MSSCRLRYLHIGVSTMTFSRKKDMIKKLGYVNIINAWDSLFTIYDRQFIARNKNEAIEKFSGWTTYQILKHINPKGFNLEKTYIYINRKGQISSTVSSRRMIKERIVDMNYLIENWHRVKPDYRELYHFDSSETE